MKFLVLACIILAAVFCVEIEGTTRNEQAEIDMEFQAVQDLADGEFGANATVIEVLDQIATQGSPQVRTEVSNMKDLFKRNNILHVLAGIGFGQLLSLINAGTSICNSASPSTLPILQNAVIYPALVLILGLPQAPYLKKFFKELYQDKREFSYYALQAALMGTADVLANAAIVEAFQSTSVLTASLISSLSVVFVFAIQALLFKAKFEMPHVLGGVLCFAGFGFIVASRTLGSSDSGQTVTGDLYALAAALGYAISNTIDERLSRYESRFPNAARFSMGAVGTIVAGILMASPLGQTDVQNLQAILNNPPIPSQYSALAVYPFLLLLLYTLTPKYFQLYGAFLFNINFLTTDLFVFIYQKATNDAVLSPFYIAGFVSIMAGLFAYSLKSVNYQARIPVIEVDQSEKSFLLPRMIRNRKPTEEENSDQVTSN